MSNTNDKLSNWIQIEHGVFTCQECENTSKPLTNSLEGMVEAHIEHIHTELAEFPTKIIYGVCPVCGMEYIFRIMDKKLYLEPSDEEK